MPTLDTEQTIVIFRAWLKSPGARYGETREIIALFPEHPGTNDPYTCDSYEHIGQHGSCDPSGVINATIPAHRDEYAALKAELESYPYYYNLVVRERMQPEYIETRRRAIAGMSPQVKARRIAAGVTR